VSTALNVARMPWRRRASRTSASLVLVSWAIRRSAKPISFARRSVSASASPPLVITGSSSTISRKFSRNHGSIFVSWWISVTEIPARSASPIANMRSGVGTRSRRRSSSSVVGRSSVSAQRSCSSERIDFWSVP